MNFNMSTSIFKEYLDLTSKYKDEYGEKTLVLLQVGAFFEIYGLRTDNGEIFGSNIEEGCSICELNVVNKQATYTDNKYKRNKNLSSHVYGVMGAGFKDYSYEKYVQKLLREQYVVVVYVQEKTETEIIRKLDAIYSPGTYICVDKNDKISNNICCIWMESFSRKGRTFLVYGVSIIDIITGKSYIFEHEVEYSMNPTTFDELERIMTTFAPSEIIMLSNMERSDIETIFNFINVTNVLTQFVSLEHEKAVNCSKQKYIHHILGTFFGEDSVFQCKEFDHYVMATQSFCFLLNFIQEHNYSLTLHIDFPLFNNNSTRMVLANHTLRQLNIIGDGQHTGVLSSVSSFLNKCITPMGRRIFNYNINNPSFDKEALQRQYNEVEIFVNNDCVPEIRILLKGVKDLEKISRLIVMKKAYPSHLYHVYNSVFIIRNIITSLHNHNIYDFDIVIDNITDFLDTHFHIGIIQTIHSLNFEENFIKPKVSETLDILINEQRKNNILYDEIHNYLNNLMRSTPKDRNVEFVKKHETNKSESLIMTKTRAKKLTSLLKDVEVEICDRSFNLKEIHFKSAGSNNDEVCFPLLTEILHKRLTLQEHIHKEMNIIYFDILYHISEHLLPEMKKMSNYLCNIDILTNKAHVSRKYNYIKPVIHDHEHSFVKASNMRHCLIEQLINNTYVPNNVCLGIDGQNGILLYGTNAVGKTSYIRAIGICIILAQSGMYVPCSEFIYNPYESIFSRILGNDNLFKGMSTFAVEISELRVILRMANANSLILGDEVCSGTETESALSIFMSALMRIHSQNSSFIFATHFHEILKYDEIDTLKNMLIYHMHVFFDREKQTMNYERVLKPGPGTRNYGLEVCKSLYVDEDFMNQTYEIRNKYFPECRGALSYKSSSYNAKKLKGMCEMCNKVVSSEVHHKKQQKDANENGFIDSLHKNHVSNLMNLCEKCHKKVHSV